MTISPSDLFLSADLTAEDARRYLETFAFADPGTADTRLQALAEDLPVREALAALAETLLKALRQTPDPDAALTAFVRYVDASAAKVTLIRYFIDDPRALAVLLDVTATSPLAADILLRNPEFLHWLVREMDRTPPDADDLADDATAALVPHADPARRLDALKRFHRREMLRIASREAVGRASAVDTARQLSLLADLIVNLVLAEALGAADLAALDAALVVVALGALAARQVDYGSELELLFVAENRRDGAPAAGDAVQALARRVSADLSGESAEGSLYQLRHAFTRTEGEGAVLSEGEWRALVGSGGLGPYAVPGQVRVVAGDPALAARVASVATGG